jgi:putative membrane protein
MNLDWNYWYSGWGWFLWFAVVFLLFSNLGTWGYTYRARRNNDASKDATDLLNERYAKGQINREEFLRIKNEIQEHRDLADKRSFKAQPIF